MIIYEGKFPIGTFVKHIISKDIYLVKALTTRDKNGVSVSYTLSNGIVVIDVISDEIEKATAEEIENANQVVNES